MATKKPKIRSLYKPPEQEYQDLKYVYERRQQMADSRAKYEKRWDSWEKQYEAYREKRSEDDWRSNIVIPTTTSIVEAQLAEIIDQNMRPMVVARGPEDKPKAVVMNAAIDYSWEVGRADIEVYKLVKSALVKGTGIAQEYYRKEKRMVRKLLKVDPKKGEVWKDEEINDFDDVYLENLKLEDFYIDEKARSFSGSYPAKDAIRRYVMRYDAFRNFFKGKIWDPMGRAALVKPGTGDSNYYEFFKPPEAVMKDKLVEVLWYWSVAGTPGNDKYQDNLIIVANDVVIKRSPIPYDHKRLPFVRAVDILKEHEFYGKGESQLLESIQEEQTTLRRMVIDRNHLDIDKGFLVSNRETDLDEEDLISRPHMMIPVDDPSNVVPLEYGDMPRSVFLSLNMLKDDAVRVTGYDDRMLSVQTPGTATEAAILKEATLKRLRSKLWLLRNLTLYQVGVLRESNIRQFYTVPKIEEIVGDKLSAEYRNTIRRAYKMGRLKMIDGKPNVMKYRTIRLNNKKIIIGDNNVEVLKNRGDTFLEISPELITPYYHSFDVKIEPTPTVPISKPLQQERAMSLFDRLIQLPGVYDPEKLGDMVIDEFDIDPDSLKKGKDVSQQFQSSLVAKSVDLAGVENDEMLSGKVIPPTPMAPEQHTEVHIALINSPQVMDLPPDSPILAILVRHIVGELRAQKQRQAALQQQGAELPQGQLPAASGYRPPSGPTALKQQGNSVIPAVAERQQNANILGELIK